MRLILILFVCFVSTFANANGLVKNKDTFTWGIFFPTIIGHKECDGDHLNLCNNKSTCESSGLYWYEHFQICTSEDSRVHTAVGGWNDSTNQFPELYSRFYPDGTFCTEEFGTPSSFGYWAPLSPITIIKRRSNSNSYSELSVLNHFTLYGVNTIYPYNGQRYYYYREINPYPCE